MLASEREPSDWKMCNCAGCDKPLLGESEQRWLMSLPWKLRRGKPELVAGRLKVGEREPPFCGECWRIYRPTRAA